MKIRAHETVMTIRLTRAEWDALCGVLDGFDPSPADQRRLVSMIEETVQLGRMLAWGRAEKATLATMPEPLSRTGQEILAYLRTKDVFRR